MPRKTDSNNPNDWLFIASAELEMVQMAAEKEISFNGARSKLAEILEKVLKAELIRLGWMLEKTHDLNRLWDLMVKMDSPLTETSKPVCQALAEVYFTDRYPGFDLDDPDWPSLRKEVGQVSTLLAEVRTRVTKK